jgi:hypothetical protein
MAEYPEWSWATLPGLEIARKEESRGDWFLTDGILSIRGDMAVYVAQGFRWGLSQLMWLYRPATYGDKYIAAQNKAAGLELCKECGGTGNWLSSMYKPCPKCNGTGGVGGTGLRGKKVA